MLGRHVYGRAGWVTKRLSRLGGAGAAVGPKVPVQRVRLIGKNPSEGGFVVEMLSRSLEVRRDPISGALSRRGLR